MRNSAFKAGSQQAKILLVLGSDRPDRFQHSGRKVGVTGHTDLYKLLPAGDPPHRLQLTPNYFRQSKRPDLDGYDCLFNMITEAEDNERVLDVLRKLARDVPGKLINRPEAVLRTTRDQVARRLSGIEGLRVPKVVRFRGSKPDLAMRTIERGGLEFPIILREAGTHTGRIVGRFDTADDVRDVLGGGHDLIATEFVDFRSADGLYRKYRMFFIGPTRIFRHMLASDDWNIHARDRKRFMAERPSLLDEEKQLFMRPEGDFPPIVQRVLESVRERMGLDLFGMDFGIGADGRVVLFEANATMNFLPFVDDPRFDYVKQCLEPAQQALRRLVGLEPSDREVAPLEPAE